MTTPHTPSNRVALETTLLAHGVPGERALQLGVDLENIVREAGAYPATIGVLEGHPIVGMSRDQLDAFLSSEPIAKANTSNLGVILHRTQTAATTVSSTVELAARDGIRLMATGGIGGVHQDNHFDVSTDLVALTRFPVAVVCSGCKSILDIATTRECLETLGVPVVGFQTDDFPAFYLRTSGCDVDAQFDDVNDLASFLHTELTRTRRGVLVVNPIPETDAIAPDDWSMWLDEARRAVEQEPLGGRSWTPRLLSELHRISQGATLEANLALVKNNARLAAQLAVAMPEQ
jgi:pseudouridylate synthase